MPSTLFKNSMTWMMLCCGIFTAMYSIQTNKNNFFKTFKPVSPKNELSLFYTAPFNNPNTEVRNPSNDCILHCHRIMVGFSG